FCGVTATRRAITPLIVLVSVRRLHVPIFICFRQARITSIALAPFFLRPRCGPLWLRSCRCALMRRLLEDISMDVNPIRIAFVGVGNCGSAMIQGIHYYRDKKPEDAIGLMHWKVGGYGPSDIKVVAAFDIDSRKVGRDVHEAIFAEPNCTTVFQPDLPASGVQ